MRLVIGVWAALLAADSFEHFRLGEEFQRRGDFQSAANEFREALNAGLDAQTEDRAHLALGNIFRQAGQTERAINEYRMVRLRNSLGQRARATCFTRVPDFLGGRPGLPELLSGHPPSSAQEEAERNLRELGAEVPDVRDVRVNAEPFARLAGEYTDEAKSAGLEGTVFVDAAFDQNGAVGEWSIVEPLGLGLDEKAAEAVRRAVFPSAGGARKTIAVDFYLGPTASRWHLTKAVFTAPPNGAPARLAATMFPPGAGISRGEKAMDHAWVVSAIGRLAKVRLDFDVDEQGGAAAVRVKNASDPMWGAEAVVLLESWRFDPAVRDGKPVRSSGSIELVWGPRNLTPAMLDGGPSRRPPE